MSTTVKDLFTAEDLYPAFSDRYSWTVFQTRLGQLRNGWTQKRPSGRVDAMEAILTPELHWRKIGRSILYTRRGVRAIERYFGQS